MKDYYTLINKEYAEITKLKNYLNNTDYKLLRELDGGEAMDLDTKLKRSDARYRINELEEEISKLKSELETEWQY